MDSTEQSLLQTLQSTPEDWDLRLLIAGMRHDRGAVDDAANLIGQAPLPPENSDQLQRAATLGGAGSLNLVRDYVSDNPEDGYGHEILAYLYEQAGDAEKAAKHSRTATALGSTNQLSPTSGSAPATPIVRVSPSPGNPSGLQTGAGARLPESVQRRSGETPRAPVTKPTGGKVTAVLVAVAMHVIIGLIAAFLVILPPKKDDPEIVAAVIGPSAPRQQMEKKKVVKQVKKSRSASSAAAPVAQLMRANAVMRISQPKVTKTSRGPLGMGDGNLGTGNFGSGSGDGLGSGASFFGGTSQGKRFAFLLDWSGSMDPEQVDMVVREMDKTLKAFKPGVEFQVLLFVGGAYFAQPDWGVKDKNGRGKNNIIVRRTREFEFESVGNSFSDYDFKGADGSLPNEDWLEVSASNIRKVMSVLEKKELFTGTDWRWPFKMALNLQPPPDVIFFMADGSGGADPTEILSYARRKNEAVQFNMFGMETTQGAKEMDELARATNGQYKIILRNGETIPGELALTNKEEAARRIRAGR